MHATATSPRTVRASAAPDALAAALADLAAAAALVADDPADRAALAAVVRQAERLARVELDDPRPDPLVVLQRRLGRAARSLARSPGRVEVEQVRGLTRALRAPAPDRVRPSSRRAPAAALAAC